MNYLATTQKPVRGATVQLVDANSAVVATGVTDAQGQFSLNPSSATLPIRVRVLAELSASNYNFAVLDNTAGETLYGMQSQAFNSATQVVNLNAPSGWGGSSYTGARVAAPFAILDMAYLAKEKVLAAAPGKVLEPLAIFWSTNNVPTRGDLALGQIGTSFFSTTTAGDALLFLLGAENSDTDEYDSAVVTHEIGHYLQHAVSRDDSIGGSHSGGDLLDMRVSFSEGWGNAWSGMVRDDPIYSDSRGPQQAQGFDYSLAVAPPSGNGWYSEGSIDYLLYQYHENASIGFTPIYTALVALRTSPAFSSVFSFNQALKTAASGATSSIDSLSTSVGINGTDAYGASESNSGGASSNLPVYKAHTAAQGSSSQYCITAAAGENNKLGNNVFISFSANGSRAFTVTRSSATTGETDPDIKIVASDGAAWCAFSEAANSEVGGATLPSGNHVMVINDFKLADTGGTRCFDLTIN